MYQIENKSDWIYLYNENTDKWRTFQDKQAFIDFYTAGYTRIRCYDGVKYAADDIEHKNPIIKTHEEEVNFYIKNKGYYFFNGYGTEIDPLLNYGDEIEKAKNNRSRERKTLQRISPFSFVYRKEPVPYTGKVRFCHSGYKRFSFYKQNLIDSVRENKWRRPGRRIDHWLWDEATSKYDSCRSWKKYRKHQYKEKN